LANETSRVFAEIGGSGKPAIVTSRGKPVAVISPIDQDDLYDWVLANAPEFVADMKVADDALVAGEQGTPLEDLVEQFAQSSD